MKYEQFDKVYYKGEEYTITSIDWFEETYTIFNGNSTFIVKEDELDGI